MARNKVIGTDPASGTKVRSGRTVTIIVSKGPPFEDVPAITQQTSYDDARRTLHRAGFEVSRQNQYDDTVPTGDVITVDPSGRARLGATVAVTVSKGPQTVELPDIEVGTDATKAVDQLTALGLNPQVEDPRGDVVDPTGRLVYQMSPGAGQTVKVGSTVVLRTV